MQISRHLLLACAAAACLTPTFLHAYDTEAQIRARQALEEKMKQIEVQAAVTNAMPPVKAMKAPPAPKPKVKAKPAMQQAAPAVPMTPPPMVSAPVVPPVPPAPVIENPPAPPAASFAPEVSQPATPAPSVTASPAYNWSAAASADASANDKLSQALHQKMSQTPVPPEVSVQPMKPMKPMAPEPMTYPETHVTATPVPMSNPTPQPIYNSPGMGESSGAQSLSSGGLPTMAAPASSLPAAKQQKLDDLLQKYRADQLTPQQYHEQRAKILGEP